MIGYDSYNTFELYTDLMKLVETNEAFFFKDFDTEGGIYRIFNYRLAQYSDWLLDGALEARGIMFYITEDKHNVHTKLVCRPMEKFFNDSENPLAENLDYTNLKQSMMKEDGSLISSYIGSDGELHLKSKGSISSEQAMAAEKLLAKDTQLFWIIECLTQDGFTVNMEYVSPTNRIVLAYERSGLVVLNVRNNETGEYVDKYSYSHTLQEPILEQWVMGCPWKDVEELKKVEGIEGAVFQLASGQHVKVKTDWYLVRHRAKDSVNNPKALIAAVLEEATDDIRSLFTGDDLTLDRIGRYEKHISDYFNHAAAHVEIFHEENVGLDRKNYAISGQDYWKNNPSFFGAQMLMYQGKEVEQYVKDKIMKNYRDYLLPEDME